MAWVRPGTHLNSIGLNPQGQELDGTAGALVAVELRESAFAAPPGGAHAPRGPPPARGVGLGELLSGAPVGREPQGPITEYQVRGGGPGGGAARAPVGG